MKFLYSVYLFVAGGFVYQMIEMAWRSRTHWSMFILGGACFLSVNLLRLTVLKECNLFLFCLIGGLCVTVLEFITGCIVCVSASVCGTIRQSLSICSDRSASRSA